MEQGAWAFKTGSDSTWVRVTKKCRVTLLCKTQGSRNRVLCCDSAREGIGKAISHEGGSIRWRSRLKFDFGLPSPFIIVNIAVAHPRNLLALLVSLASLVQPCWGKRCSRPSSAWLRGSLECLA